MKYHAYNLCIDSDFPLNPLHVTDPSQKGDVVIRRGRVAPDGLPEPAFVRRLTQAAENAVWLNVEEVARFLIEEGSRVTVEPYEGATEDAIRVYLLGTVLGAVLHQRGNLVLHANAIRVGDGAVLFAGESGAGKSTTAAVFHQKGYQVIADDVVAVNQDELVIGGFPQIKLWEDALNHLEIERDGLDLIRHQVNKYSYPIDLYTDEHLPVSAVYFLSPCDEAQADRFEFVPLEGVEKFYYLREYTYRPKLMEGLGFKARHLQLAGKMAHDIIAASIVRPTRQFNAVQLADRVLQHLEENGVSTSPEHE